MSAHQDHPHLDKVKSHFISGEPGTTGREPFEDSTASGPGANFNAVSGQGATGANAGLGSHSGAGLTGQRNTGAGLTGQHTSGSGLTGSSHTNTHGEHSSHSHAGPNDTGAGVLGSSANQHQHNSQTSAAGSAGAVGIAGAGLTGLSHPPREQATGHDIGHAGSSAAHPSHTSHAQDSSKDGKGIIEKVKDALPGHNSSSTTNTTSHSTGNTHSNTHNSSTGAIGSGNRDVVDKVNDALPGTPAKTEQHYGTSHNPTTQGQHGSSGLTGAAVGAGAAGIGHHNSASGVGHNSSTSGSGLTGSGLTGATHSGQRDHGDRVGTLGQDASKYEGDLNSGPRTSGAAGTERFDSSRTGAPGNVGAGLDRQHDDGVHHDTSQRAPGKSSGGLSGLLATSDKDFTGRERKGEGAYADTDGLYKLNSTGPGGNSALTGREGNLDNNPVAKAASRDGNPVDAHNAHATHGTDAAHGEKKGFLAKVKDALS